MATEREDTAKQHCSGITRQLALLIEPHPRGQRRADLGMQQHLPPLQCGCTHVEDHWPLSGGETEAERIGPQRRSCPSRGDHVRLTAGQVNAD
jgi:hypothetical protein